MNCDLLKASMGKGLTDAEAIEPMENRAERRKRIPHRPKQLVAGASQNRQATETMRIGDFRLTRMAPGKIWINICGDGEGGEFKEVDIEAAIGKFYADNF